MLCQIRSHRYPLASNHRRHPWHRLQPGFTEPQLIRDLQDAGFDVQITGFGRMDAYHANNEFAYISDYKAGARIVAHTIANLEDLA